MQGGIKYHFWSLWYESTWDWTLVSWTISDHRKQIERKLHGLLMCHYEFISSTRLFRWLFTKYKEILETVFICRKKKAKTPLPLTFAQSAGAVEYIDCTSAEDKVPPHEFPDMTHKTIWWSDSSNAGAFENAEYPFPTIAPRSTLARSGSTW